MKVYYTYTAYLVISRKLWDWNIMENLNQPSIQTDGGTIKETDSMGR